MTGPYLLSCESFVPYRSCSLIILLFFLCLWINSASAAKIIKKSIKFFLNPRLNRGHHPAFMLPPSFPIFYRTSFNIRQTVVKC